MSGAAPAILAEEGHFPPGTDSFNYADWFGGLPKGMITTITFMVFLGVGLIILFFMLANRNPKLVPTRGQWIAESLYGFVRNGIVKDIIGPEGLRFAPYFATLFSFILMMNVFAIIPMFQISPNSHIAFPAVLGVLSWLLYNWVGIKKHGFWKYIKNSCIPSGTPIGMYPIIVPIEFLSNLILRPVTLAVRLFANMFAGHMILLVFTLGGVALLNAESVFLRPVSVVSFAMAIVMTFFEFFVQLLQAYVFTLLTAVYVQGSLADEH
ncbi:ATP synthase subunit a [Actinorhabdospora filicis]|uniref:ATP synthase subunit a n=1 Tax=Actinorhabdospora filicis TaxID=1785913 RepID=A0A9W6SEW2_9ACTN|nr:ATP synthase subunit a [Actinorhabdospora filicis]